jgi:signal peptidase II
MPIFLKDALHRPPGSLWLPVGVLIFAIATDQLSKMAARGILATTGDISVFGGLVRFSLIDNHEGFLGIVRGLPPWLQFFFLYVGVTLLLVFCLIYLFFLSRPNCRFDIPLGLVTGGGLSNLLDRILHDGGVTDFMILAVGSLHTGIFNLADVSILFGSFILGFSVFSSPDR